MIVENSFVDFEEVHLFVPPAGIILKQQSSKRVCTPYIFFAFSFPEATLVQCDFLRFNGALHCTHCIFLNGCINVRYGR